MMSGVSVQLCQTPPPLAPAPPAPSLKVACSQGETRPDMNIFAPDYSPPSHPSVHVLWIDVFSQQSAHSAPLDQGGGGGERLLGVGNVLPEKVVPVSSRMSTSPVGAGEGMQSGAATELLERRACGVVAWLGGGTVGGATRGRSHQHQERLCIVPWGPA